MGRMGQARVDEATAGAGVQYTMATLSATQGKIDAALRDQKPPMQPQKLPHCQANDLRASETFREAIE